MGHAFVCACVCFVCEEKDGCVVRKLSFIRLKNEKKYTYTASRKSNTTKMWLRSLFAEQYEQKIAQLQAEKDVLLFSLFALLMFVFFLGKQKESRVKVIRVQTPKTRNVTMHERGASALTKVWTHQSDIFRAHVLPKLNAVDVKMLSLVSRETRAAIRRAGRKLKVITMKISDFSSISTLQYAMVRISKYNYYAKSPQYVCSEVAATGRIDILKWLTINKRLPCDGRTLENAAEEGHLAILVHARKKLGCCWTEPHEGEYFCDNCNEWHEDEEFEPSERPVELAARNAHLECVKFCHEEGCPYNDEQLAINAVRSINIDLLKYVHEVMEVELFCSWQNVIEEAAEDGFLEGLKYLKVHSSDEWEDVDQEHACICAAENGHLNCLKYLHECGFAWNEEVCNSAYINGHMECFEFARSKGCAFDASLLRGAF